MLHAASEQNPGPTDYDAELQRHNQVLRRAVGVQLRYHILDIGCGTGQTTRQAGAHGPGRGPAVGVDVSARAIERALELARAERLGNVTFQHANARVTAFRPERFDLAISSSTVARLLLAPQEKPMTSAGSTRRPLGGARRRLDRTTPYRPRPQRVALLL